MWRSAQIHRGAEIWPCNNTLNDCPGKIQTRTRARQWCHYQRQWREGMQWLTVSNATVMSSKMRTEEDAQATLCLYVIENRAISVEWPFSWKQIGSGQGGGALTGTQWSALKMPLGMGEGRPGNSSPVNWLFQLYCHDKIRGNEMQFASNQKLYRKCILHWKIWDTWVQGGISGGVGVGWGLESQCVCVCVMWGGRRA